MTPTDSGTLERHTLLVFLNIWECSQQNITQLVVATNMLEHSQCRNYPLVSIP
jgi:hypothetical protein